MYIAHASEQRVKQSHDFLKMDAGGQDTSYILYPVNDCKDESEIAEHTAIDMYQWLHGVCSTRLLQDPPIVLSGSGVIVEVDESLFQHKLA